jgi:hypothetical protein
MTGWSSGASTVAMEGMLKSTRNGSRKIPHVRMGVSINASGHRISIEILIINNVRPLKSPKNYEIIEFLNVLLKCFNLF